MKSITAIALLLATPVFAVDSPQSKGPDSNFEQRKANVLKHIDMRIVRNQEEKSCVQAAQNPDDLKACREKFKEDIRDQMHKKT